MDLTQHQGPGTLSSLRAESRCTSCQPATNGTHTHTHSGGSGVAPNVQSGAEKQCSPRKSSKENLSLSQIWNTTRAGILLSVLSSLQKASWPRGGAEKEVKREIRERLVSFQPRRLPGGGSGEWGGASLRDLPEPGSGRKTHETPKSRVQVQEGTVQAPFT